MLAGTIAIAMAIDAARADEPPPSDVETIQVIGAAPLPGEGQQLTRVPANVQRLDDVDVARFAPFAVTDLLGVRNVDETRRSRRASARASICSTWAAGSSAATKRTTAARSMPKSS